MCQCPAQLRPHLGRHFNPSLVRAAASGMRTPSAFEEAKCPPSRSRSRASQPPKPQPAGMRVNSLLQDQTITRHRADIDTGLATRITGPLRPRSPAFAANRWLLTRSSRPLSVVDKLPPVEVADAAESDQLDDAEHRLRLCIRTSPPGRPRRTHFAIMRLFSSTLMADLSAVDVSSALAAAEREGRIDPGESGN